MEDMDHLECVCGDVNIVHKTVQSLLDSVEKSNNPIANFSLSIFMAPSILRTLSPSSFKPRVVSIGPLHIKDENLQRFEVWKVAIVYDLLAREVTVAACVTKVANMIERIKGSYAADMKSYDDSELAEMMVMDACFILVFINEIAPQPPPPSSVCVRTHSLYDLVLLENQIPFFVLNEIYECVKYKLAKPCLPLTEFILPLLEKINLFKGSEKVRKDLPSSTNHDHILGYFHHCYAPRYYIPSGFPISTFHSAVELDQAGVNFTPNQDEEWPMAMKVKWSRYWSSIFLFSLKPTLTMPTLHINDFTELVLRNLIAYEHSSEGGPYVTSYAKAMDMLVDTHEDITELVRSKVIVNHKGSNEEAANMINRICKEVVQEHFFYTQQWEQLDSHFKRYWPRKIVKLKRTYFHSPWSIIALLAGIVLFILAMLQTIFTIMAS